MFTSFARSVTRVARAVPAARTAYNNHVAAAYTKRSFASLSEIRDNISSQLTAGNKFSDAEWEKHMDELEEAYITELKADGTEYEDGEIDAIIALEKATFSVVRERKLPVAEELAALDDGSNGDRWIDDLDTWDNPAKKTVYQAFQTDWNEELDGKAPVGLQRQEWEALKYDYDIFHDGVFSPNWGTIDNPRMVRSAYGQRIVGCTGGGPDPEHEIRWINMTDVDTKYECDLCSQCFQLAPVDYVEPEEH